METTMSGKGNWAPALALLALLAACGGGGSSGSGGTTTPPAAAANVVPVVLDSGPLCPTGAAANICNQGQAIGTVNVPYTSVKVCVPGTNTCQTIDHIMIDTGSFGLRLMSSVLNSSMQFPAVQDSTSQLPLLECLTFADGYSWGTVHTADIYIGGETAAHQNIQIIGDSGAGPNACSSTGAPLNDVVSFGANGVLGVGLFVADCLTGASCPAGSGFYYTCTAPGTCTDVAVGSKQQVSNPVAAFAAINNGTPDNNGVILTLPSVGPSGALNPTGGSLVFGINTQSNNKSGAQTVYLSDYLQHFNSTITAITNTSAYTVTTTPYASSFIDSGSNGIFLPGTTIPSNSGGFFVPTQPASEVLTLTASIQGTDPYTNLPTGAITPITFSVGNADNLLAFNNTAFSNLGGSNLPGTGVDWGSPFFMGRTVYIGLENSVISINNSSATGPFWAF